VDNEEVVALKAEDIGRLMLRAGLHSDQILEQGADLRDALARQGGAEIHRGSCTEVVFSVHLPYVHVCSRNRGTFTYDVSRDSRGSFVYEVKPAQQAEATLTPPVANAQSSPPAPAPAEKPVSTEKPVPAEKKGGQPAVASSPAKAPAVAPAPVTTKVASARPAEKSALKSAAPSKPAATATSSKPPVADLVSPLPPKPQPQPESPAPAKSAAGPAQAPAPQPSAGVPGPTFPKIVGMLSDGLGASSSKSATVSAVSAQPRPVLAAQPVSDSRIVPSPPSSLRGVGGSCALAAFLVDDWSYYCGLAANTWTATHHPPQKKSRSGRSISD
jgi:hypothetical protein